MGKSRIPKATAPSDSCAIAKPSFVPSEGKVTFSFLPLEKTEYFNLDATCPGWSADLFDMLKGVSGLSAKQLKGGGHKTYRVHNHESAKPPNPLPKGVSLKECYQIRISKSKGGIHGVFSDDVFYVIWLDPLHNMYPDDRYGGLKTIKPPKTCCMDLEETIAGLKEQIAQLKEERDIWENMAQEACEKQIQNNSFPQISL